MVPGRHRAGPVTTRAGRRWRAHDDDRPRTGVPPARGLSLRGSALGVLRGLAGLLQAGLLALDGAGVAGEVPGTLEARAVGLGVDLVERTSHAQAQRAGLAGDATAVDARDDVEATLEVEQGERGVHHLLVELVGEVVLQRTTVDRPLARPGDETHARDRLLAARSEEHTSELQSR